MNIYVGNLTSNTTEEDLLELFSAFGKVNSTKLIKDYETGQSRGFGFVDMSQNEGTKAIEELNGTDFNGNFITVNEAFEKRNNSRGNGNYGNSRNNGGGYKRNRF